MALIRRSRPRDPVQLGKLICDIATGEIDDFIEDGKDPHAVELGRLGGPARAKKLTPQQRSDIARKAAAARWKK